VPGGPQRASARGINPGWIKIAQRRARRRGHVNKRAFRLDSDQTPPNQTTVLFHTILLRGGWLTTLSTGKPGAQKPSTASLGFGAAPLVQQTFGACQPHSNSFLLIDRFCGPPIDRFCGPPIDRFCGPPNGPGFSFESTAPLSTWSFHFY